MAESKIAMTYNHKRMIRGRGLDPNNYDVIKDTYTSLYLRDKRTGRIKILTRYN